MHHKDCPTTRHAPQVVHTFARCCMLATNISRACCSSQKTSKARQRAKPVDASDAALLEPQWENTCRKPLAGDQWCRHALALCRSQPVTLKSPGHTSAAHICKRNSGCMTRHWSLLQRTGRRRLRQGFELVHAKYMYAVKLPQALATCLLCRD